MLHLFVDKYPSLISYAGNKNLDVIVCLLRLFKWSDVKNIVLDIFRKLEVEELHWDDKDNLIEIMEYFAKFNLTKLIPISLNEIFVKLTEGYLSIHFFTETLPNLLNYPVYEKVLADMGHIDFNSYREFKNNIIYFWEQNIEKYILTSNVTTAESKEEIDQIANEKIKEITKLTEQLKVYNFISLRKFKFKSEEQLLENNNAKAIKKLDIENVKNKELYTNEISEINRLFDYVDNSLDDDLPF